MVSLSDAPHSEAAITPVLALLSRFRRFSVLWHPAKEERFVSGEGICTFTSTLLADTYNPRHHT